MHIIAAPQRPSIALEHLGLADLPEHARLVRRLARVAGLRLLAWSTRSTVTDDRESIRRRHDTETARAAREQRWQSDALRLPVR
ncbi:hypothetical protein ACFC1I_06730 [Microbacterium sp. NPDC056044]|uniref:hypothetical protein n=1 Tax=Microbacterium sp. NPDC056044 TaxID=3345690 RepID=UPI0035E3B9FF